MFLRPVVMLIALLCLFQQARASLLFCDTFSDYNDGGLVNQMGGLGGKGHWGGFEFPEGSIQPDLGQSRFLVTNSALSGDLITHAKRVMLTNAPTDCEIKRKLGTSLGEPGTTRYLRFLLRAEFPQDAIIPSFTYMGVELRSNNFPKVFVGKIKNGTLGFGASSHSASVSATNWFLGSTSYVLVMKMQFMEGNDRLTLYIDPNPSDEPTSGITRTNLDLRHIDMIALVANLKMSVDEIVIADTYADALNVSSPPITPIVSIESGSILERDNGTNVLMFTANLSTPVTHEVSVDFKTVDGTAVAGQDYISRSGTLIFPPGTISSTGTVGVIGDISVEEHEEFSVNLSNPVSAKFSSTALSAGSTWTITDDDVAPPSAPVLTRNGGEFTVAFTALTSGFALEESTNLFEELWYPVTPLQQTQTSVTSFLFQATQTFESGSRFYRVRRSR